jgi:nucleoside-diphosphate-sugar epimerase
MSGVKSDMSKKINLVTGASGFLGSHLVEELIRRDKSVRVLVRESSNLAFLRQFDLEYVYGSLSDKESLLRATENVDIIYNCAAHVSDFGPYELFEDANITGVHNLLKSCLINRPERIIHVSTTDVYGYPDFAADESQPFIKRGFNYGDTKIEGENLIWIYYDNYKLPITVFRPATIYGERSVSFIDEIILMLKKREYVHIGRKEVNAGLIHVSNLVEAMLMAEKSDKSIGQAFNIIDGNGVSFTKLVNSLADLTGLPRPSISIPVPVAYGLGYILEIINNILRLNKRPYLSRMVVSLFGISQDFSTDKIREELDWEPTVSFEEGMDRIRKSLKL